MMEPISIRVAGVPAGRRSPLLPPPYARGLRVAWILVVVIGVVAFIFGRFNALKTSHTIPAGHMAMSAILVGVAFVWWRVVAQGTHLSGYTAGLFFGMLASWMGDLILADFIPLPEPVIGGMAAFGVAHIGYIVGYRRLARVRGLAHDKRLIAFLSFYWLVAGLLWVALVRNPQGPALLNYGALGYAVLLSSMAAVATHLAVAEPRLVWLAAGANLFLLSDIILGNWLLRGNHWFLVSDVVWVFYAAGQALIVYSPARALGWAGTDNLRHPF